MHSDAEQRLVGRLEPGESLVWSGTPRQGLVFRSTDVFLIPFSIMWGGFAVFWEVGVIRSGAPIFMALWGIPFVAMGLYMTIGRFFVDARVRANTSYGLTDRRVVIVSGFATLTTRSLPLRSLGEVSLVERADGSGSILFGAQAAHAIPAGFHWPGTGAPPLSLELIPDARSVYTRLLDVQRRA